MKSTVELSSENNFKEKNFSTPQKELINSYNEKTKTEYHDTDFNYFIKENKNKYDNNIDKKLISSSM